MTNDGHANRPWAFPGKTCDQGDSQRQGWLSPLGGGHSQLHHRPTHSQAHHGANLQVCIYPSHPSRLRVAETRVTGSDDTAAKDFLAPPRWWELVETERISYGQTKQQSEGFGGPLHVAWRFSSYSPWCSFFSHLGWPGTQPLPASTRQPLGAS